MRPWLYGWAVVGGLALVHPASAQDVTRIDPVIEVQQKLPAEVDPDDLIPVEVRIKNSGKAAAEAITVTDVPRAGVELVGSEPPAVRASGTLGWHIGRLGPGEEKVIRVRMKRAAGAIDPQFMHTVEVTFQAKGRHTGEAAVRQPALTFAAAGGGAATVGTPATLRLTVTNPGTSPVRDIVLATALAEGLVHSAGSDLEKNIGTLEPGQSRIIPLTVTPKKVGDLGVKFRLTARGMNTAVEETTRLQAAPPPVALAAVQSAVVEVERSALFELVVSNDAAESRTGVEVRLTLPKEVAFVRATDRGTFDAATRTVKWDVGTIRPGEKRGVVWNGMMTAAGHWACPAVLVVDGKVQSEVTCTVKAVAAGER
ncbi:MAG TPA: hypothetical protein VM597_38350 [Gemmataceae bacterium]|jgi:hypothetical protein|nr:hypothetical protein [Gemmataceae bacterium]